MCGGGSRIDPTKTTSPAGGKVKFVTEAAACGDVCTVGYVYQPGVISSVIVHMTVWPRFACAGSTPTDAVGTASRNALFLVGGGLPSAQPVAASAVNTKAALSNRAIRIMRFLRARNGGPPSWRFQLGRFHALQLERA